jgi:hypothetical protein
VSFHGVLFLRQQDRSRTVVPEPDSVRVLHGVERYAVEAVGITLSERQAQVARERIARAGQGKRCRVEIRDYRSNIPNAASAARSATSTYAR